MEQFRNRLSLIAVVAVLVAALGGGAFGFDAVGVGRSVGFHW